MCVTRYFSVGHLTMISVFKIEQLGLIQGQVHDTL